MDSVKEDGLYRYREVKLPSLIPSVSESELEPELERETRQRRKGRDIFLAVDQGPNSKYAFDWALIHLCRMVDTLHLVNAVSSIKNEVVHDANQGLMEKIAVEAYQVAMVKCVARIVEGDAGKVICQEAKRIKPAAAVVGTHGRSLMQSVLKGSVSKYCFHRRKAAPVMVVPGKEAGDVSLITAKLEKRYKLEPKRSTISFMSSFLAGVLQVVLRFIQQKNNL